MPEPIKTLIVDDEEDLIMMLQLNLECKGFTVQSATNGKDGIKLAQSFQPDVIVLDIMMPGMDGWEVCAALQADPQTNNIPIVFLTASKESELQEKAQKLGTEIMFKPYEMDEIIDLLKKQTQK
ncbi:hypothetical protein BVY03_00810 [bacterium K02(2017)]|nr:hypothetical protein BVY03_00810 [bacterium K02(2017)]